MARKRLTPAHPAAAAAPETKALGFARTVIRERPPIARHAAESAAEAALTQLAAEHEAARAEGRLVVSLPLDAVEEGHLVRDRLHADDAEMEVLKRSLAERGQQTPIEVVELGEDGARYGLVSGWRRLTALRQLHAETGEDRFARVQALLRRPESAADAYRAMVDENEIRVGLSHWERARIAARAAELGLYPTARHAVRGLFAAASAAKRSKIGSFLVLYRALDGALRFPTELPERRGLALAQAIEADEALTERLRRRLAEEEPATAEAEQAVLAAALRPPRTGRGRSGAQPTAASPDAPAREIVLSGPGIDADFAAELGRWLAARKGEGRPAVNLTERVARVD